MANANTVTLNGYADTNARPGIFANLSRMFAEYRTYHQVLGELEGYSDRELSDIGLSRTSIRDVARNAAVSTR